METTLRPHTRSLRNHAQENRNLPYLRQGCKTCSTLITHNCNADAALNSSNASATSPVAVHLQQPPANHPILLLTHAFKNAIQRNDIQKHENQFRIFPFMTAQTSVKPNDRREHPQLPPSTTSEPTRPDPHGLLPKRYPGSQDGLGWVRVIR